MSTKRYVVDNRKPSIFSKISQAAVLVGSIATATVITTPAFGFLDLPAQSPEFAQGNSLPTSNSAAGAGGYGNISGTAPGQLDAASSTVDPTATASASPTAAGNFSFKPVTVSGGSTTPQPSQSATTDSSQSGGGLVFEPTPTTPGTSTGNTTSPTTSAGGSTGGSTGNTTSPTSATGGSTGGNTGGSTGGSTGNTTNPTQGGGSSEDSDDYEDDEDGEDSEDGED